MNFKLLQRPLALALALAASAAIAGPQTAPASSFWPAAGAGASAPSAGPARKMPQIPDLTRAEFLKRAAESFDRMDANHDGTVTGAEQMAFVQARRAEMMRKLQADQAGKPEHRGLEGPGARPWGPQDGVRKAPAYVQP